MTPVACMWTSLSLCLLQFKRVSGRPGLPVVLIHTRDFPNNECAEENLREQKQWADPSGIFWGCSKADGALVYVHLCVLDCVLDPCQEKRCDRLIVLLSVSMDTRALHFPHLLQIPTPDHLVS